jgi:hypothetical protein
MLSVSCRHVPTAPSLPVGMDVYEMGTYSSDEKASEAELFRKIPVEVSLEWMGRIGQDVGPEGLYPDVEAMLGSFRIRRP